MSRIWLASAAVLMALAVILGAFGAHALKGRLDQYALDVYNKANFYHFIHALGLLLVVNLSSSSILPEIIVKRVCLLLLIGTLIFSGSLYGLALSGVKALGAITPLGGVTLIIAWLYLAYACIGRSG